MIAKNELPDGHDNVWGELQKLTKQLQEQITAAGQQGENAKIFTLAERLRRADALVQQYVAIRQGTDELTRPQDAGSHENTNQLLLRHLARNGSHPSEEHPKTRGKRLRTDWIVKYGKTLKHLHRTLYQNSKGELVGIACATEKRGTNGPEGRWWLGLPRDQFQSAVLLCEKSDGNVHAICLPRDFIDEHRSRFSKSSSGQEQFTVLRNATKWYLQVPTAGTVEMSLYVDNPSMVL
jgi:hypothetical protein